MSALRLKLATIALVSTLGASAAHAQSYPSLFAKQGRQAEPARVQVVQPAPGRVAVTQQGRGNGAAISQNGPRNGAVVDQRGDNNEGQIIQDGANNSAAIYQLGRNNSGTIMQSGSNNDACLVQLNGNNAAGITQTGDNNSIGIAQNAARTWEFSPELCSQYGDNPWALKRQIRAVGLPPAKG
jgi:hypothetical protein